MTNVKLLATSVNYRDRVKAAYSPDADYEILENLSRDEDYSVRAAVAHARPEFRDMLVHDPEWPVRLAIAEEGSCLDILMNDPRAFVRTTAQLMAKKLGVTANG